MTPLKWASLLLDPESSSRRSDVVNSVFFCLIRVTVVFAKLRLDCFFFESLDFEPKIAVLQWEVGLRRDLDERLQTLFFSCFVGR
ncbi:hypothetical protein M6B38_377300 [Iris pallida]|uniref:Uncharacterized protein n=1 Tax=Iris pallida TaxID=29817 RepID=A0AAX6GBG7_IRIPA|nr:hypothetical protein M6B38_377300 [Iris pallida]